MKKIHKENKKTKITEVAKPVLANKDEVIVKIKVGAICRTDVYVQRNQIPSNDVIIGHECAGIIEEIGGNVEGFAVGDVVSINPFIGCNECEHCRKQNFQLCLEQQMLGKEVDGVFCGFVKINKRNLVKFNPSTSLLSVAFFEPVLAMSAILHTSMKRTDQILIYGDNRIATLTKRILTLHGYKYVDCEIPKSADVQYDYVVETVPNAEGFNRAISMLKPNGTLILKSRMFNPIEVDMFSILQRGITIESAYYYDNIPQVVSMIEDGLYLEDLMGQVFPLERYEEVFQQSLQKESLKNFLEVE